MNRQDYGDGGSRYESANRTGEIVQGGGYAQMDFSQAGGYYGGESERYGGRQYSPGRDYGRGQGYGGERYGGHEPNYGYRYDEGWVQSPLMEEMEYNEGIWQTNEPGSQEGPYRGRGPRGYQRSDDRIREDVCDRLTHHGHVDAGEMDVEVSNGEVTLKGEVADRRQKRLAEDITESVRGVKDVHNQLRVSSGQATTATGSASSEAQMSAASTEHNGRMAGKAR